MGQCTAATELSDAEAAPDLPCSLDCTPELHVATARKPRRPGARTARLKRTGGTTAWKLGEEARGLVRTAQERGPWCHMGRVNSLRRLRLAALDGYDSVDGTYLAFGPDKNLPRLLTFLRLASQPTLFGQVTTQRRRDAGPGRSTERGLAL